jgi:hypothetical protein
MLKTELKNSLLLKNPFYMYCQAKKEFELKII